MLTVTNLMQGPANVWAGLFGVTEPTSNAAAVGVGWNDCGATDGGVELRVNQQYSMLTVDQVAGPADARLQDMTLEIGTTLAEPTLANIRQVLNQVASAATFVEIDPTITNMSPAYAAILFRAVRPGQGGPRTVILRRVLSTANIQTPHRKDAKTGLPVTFTGFYVSPTIKPIKIDDTP